MRQIGHRHFIETEYPNAPRLQGSSGLQAGARLFLSFASSGGDFSPRGDCNQPGTKRSGVPG